MTDVFDSSDPRAIADAIKANKAQETNAKEGLLATMRDPNGRAWLYKILMACGCFSNPFSSDALRMAHNCGEANIGLQIIADMQDASAELYLKTMKENNNG